MYRQKPRVLIVDNDEHILISLERLLEDEGCETTTASSGEEALQLIGAGKLDLVLLDDHLSDAHCVELLDRLRLRGIQIRCMVTCHRTPNSEEEACLHSLGVRAVVKKQAHHEIAEAVQHLLRGSPHSLSSR